MRRDLAGKTILMSGGSRGIGLAIAVRAASDGANVAILAKTESPHPKLEGTVFTAAQEIEEAGGRALPIVGDVRDESALEAATAAAVSEFGGIDILVNNASAIDLRDADEIPAERYDLIQDVNARATFLLSRQCVPILRRSSNPHVLTLSPPLNMEAKWFTDHLAYTISKYGMSMVTLGMAARHREDGIAFNSLWPRTLIATAAVQNFLGGREAMRRARLPGIMADAAHSILTRDSGSFSGNFCLDEWILSENGVSDFSGYACSQEVEPDLDLFVESAQSPAVDKRVTEEQGGL